ncbi:MAG: filamentous hemagglutinin N-terminal domain-containing protein [Erythrobacter sp.]|nr:MAG: filamentous hemagglutinin N-terminal domain-containing protein [Erythrobacter sp.]
MSQSKTLSSPRLVHGLRRSLLIGTALTVWSIPAYAQVAPPPNTAPVNTGAGGATITTNAAVAPADDALGFDRRYEIDVDGASRILTFSSYDVASNVIVDYVNNAAPGAQLTAVNNISAGNPSDIFGLIRAESDINVWLINPDGIAFGSSGAFSGASLLVSTLPWDNIGLANLAAPNFERNGGGAASALVISPGASLGSTASPAGGSVILVSERLTMGGNIEATGDVVLVGARDVTFANVPGSPLSFTITEGVRVNQTANGVQVTGSITGANIGVAGAGFLSGGGQNVNQLVLGIGPDATLTATANNGVIILATASEAGITIANTAVREDIRSQGDLVTTGTSANIVVTSADGVSMAGGSADATGDVELTTAAGQISGSGDFTITGANVSITSPTAIDFDSTTSIGTSGSFVGDVVIAAPGAIELGDVFANSLGSSLLGALTENELTLGNVTTTLALDVITSNDTLTFASLNSTTGNVDVDTGTGNIAGGDISATNVDVQGNAVTLGTVTATFVVGVTANSDLNYGTLTGTGSSVFATSTAGDIIGGDITAGTGASLTANAGSIDVENVTAGIVSMSAQDEIEFTSATSSVFAVGIISTSGAIAGGDIDSATFVDVEGTQVELGNVDAIGDIDVGATAGTLTFASLETTTGNIAGTATGAILGAGDATANSGTVAFTGASLDLGTILGTQVDLIANGAGGDIGFVSIDAGAGTVTIDSDDGEIVGGGDIVGGAVFLAAGAGNNSNDITVGDVTATSLSNSNLVSELAAPNLTLGNVTVDSALILVASDGDLEAGVIRTNGTNIALTAFDTGGGGDRGDVLIDGAFTSLAGAPTTGSIGIYAEGDVGVNIGGNGNGNNPVPEGIINLEAGEDISVLSDDGNIFLDSVIAGDDITLTALDNSQGRVSFESIQTTGQNIDTGAVVFVGGPGAATSVTFSAVETILGSITDINAFRSFIGSVTTDNFIENTLEDPAVYKGDIIATGFIQISAPSIVLGKNNEARTFSAGDFIDIRATTGNLSYAGDVTLISNTNPVVNGPATLFDGIFLGAAGAIAGIDANDTISLQAGTAGNLQPVFVQAGTSAAITSASGLFLDFDAQAMTLGMAGGTNAFTADETIDIDTSLGDLLFAGDVTLTSNADGAIGIALDGIALTVAGNIGVVPGGSASLLGGVPGSRTAVNIALGGDLALDSVNATSLAVTNLLAAPAPGDIAIGNVTTEQALILRSSGGTIDVDVASVTNLGAVLLLAAGGGNDVTSGTSLTTNGGSILLSAANNVAVELVDNGGAGVIAIASGGDTLIGSGIVSGDDIVIEAGGNVGAPGALVNLDAGDDIRLTSAGTIFLDSAVTDGGGNQALFTITGGGTENASGFFGAETLTGSQIVLSAVNLLGPALTGSVEDALVVRDLTAGSADLSAALGEIRLGAITANAGNIDIDATAGSVSGLANGWVNLGGGSTITAPGNITLNITGNAEIGLIDGAVVTGTSFDRLTVGTLIADAATLTAVNRLQVDSGTVAGVAQFITAGGVATDPSLTGSPPIAGFGRADLTATGLLTVAAGSGAAQLGALFSEEVGAAITVSAEAVDVSTANTITSGGNILLTATQGQLTLGSAGSAGALTLDKLGASGQITVNGALVALDNVDVDSATDISAEFVRSLTGDIDLASNGDTDFTTALANVGSFTATTTAGSGGDVTALLVQAQGAVQIDADGAITIDTDPDFLASPGFTRSIQSLGSTVTLASGADIDVFSVEAAGAVDIDSGANLRFDSVTGAAITLDAVDDITGLAGVGAVSDPLPGFLRGDVTGTTITVGALGTTGIVQLDLLDASGLVDVDADRIDISTIDAATIELTSSLADVRLGEGDASGNITVIATTSATVFDANSTGGDIAVFANGGDATLVTATAAAVGGDITLLASGNVIGTTLTGGGVLNVDTFTGDAILTSAVMGGAIDVDAGDNIRLGTLTGGLVTLDAANDISGLAGAGAGTDPLPAFLRGTVDGTSITIGALGTTGIVQLGLLNATGAVVADADQIDLTTVNAASIDLASTLADVTLFDGNASGNIIIDAATDAIITTADSTAGNIDIDAGGNIRLGTLSGGLVTLDAGDDISGLAGAGAGTDPLPAFLRGDVNGSAITIGALGTTGIVQLDALTGSGAGAAITVSAGAIDVTSATTTLGGGNIALTATAGQLTLGTATSLGTLTLDKLGATGQITVTGALQSRGLLDIDSATAISATTLGSTLGNIRLESSGDTDFDTALADAGSFTAITTAGSGGDLTADRVRAQGAVLIDADGAITLDGDPFAPAIPGFTRSIHSVGSTVTLASGADIDVFSVEAAGFVDIDAGTDLRFASVTGTAITLDAGDDITGLAGAGAATDPLPGFLRGTVDGTSITIGALGTTGIVQLGLLDATGAVVVDGDRIDLTTVNAASIDLASTLADVTLFDGNASGNVTVLASTDAIITTADSTGGNIDVDAGDNIRLGTLTGGLVTLDAANDISGLAGAGAGSDPLPAFLRGNVNGSAITIGALGTTGIVQLGTLTAGGAVIVDADRIDISTINAGTIDLTSTLDRVDLGEGDASGNITVIAATSALVTDANSTGGDISVRANGGDATLVTGTAAAVGGDITLFASGDAIGTTLSGGGILNVDTTTGDALLTLATMGGAIDVDAGDNIRLGTLSGAAVTLDAANDISGLAGAGAGTDPLPAFLRGDVNGSAITIGALGTTDVVQLGLLDANGAVTVTAGLVDVSAADAGTFIDIAATDGALTLGSGTAGTTIDLDKTGANGALAAGTLLAGGNITANSSTSLLLSDVTSTGGSLIANATGAAGNGDAIVTLADTSGTILITSANATAGGDTLDGSGITLDGVSIEVATLAAAGVGGIVATANGGDLFVATGTSGADITLTKTGDVDPAQGITANTLTAVGDIDVISDTFVDIGNSSAGGFLNLVSPDTIDADLLDSAGGIAINTGGDANLGEITSGGTIVLLAAGDIDADTLTAAEDIAALAGGGIAIGDFTAGDNVTLTAGTAFDLGGGATTGSGADNATYVLDLAQAGDTSPTSTAITDGPADAENGDVLLAAPDDFNLTGAIDVAAADGTITVRNLAGGSTSTSVGTTGGFEISDAELNFLSADNVVIDSGDKALALGNFTVPGQSLQLLSTSTITLSGAITGTGTGTLQIGQGTIGANGLVDPATLTETIVAATDAASIDFAGGIVDLRAVRIVFGTPEFLAATQGISLDAAAELLTNAGSLLYIGDNSQRVFLEADTLRVAYSDFALFQNTAFSQGGGVILNADAANAIDSLALELFSQGDDNLDSFALFGEINGFIGRTAGVLPNAVLNIGTLSPRELRVTQSRSRVNGCVIGSPDRGCLIVDLPPPEITTIDERQAQSLISTGDPSEFLNPLVGRGNEGLILDIAQIPVGIDMLECDADDPTCEPTETEE